ncbi:putative bifunctional diguanylate cyclase/phosphodiesterase [Komagataeibacter swingsii]|uniref:GGDEF domain-containing protein n=1 Tax=Komagataeibacter swingsii TaxID=215220 RepID=A0A2V4R6K2_9PROT|nr:GGDEF and EAL domain-containing protein [Komagataeibacter swingsii]PYD70403.1 GGDEF domain-containing protein [Komagataeibacter swingsii]GBQ55675.1 diguanylate cyclase [Komagataeibacter swingsii DSM 16373]
MSAPHDNRLRALTHEDADFWADVVDNVLIVAVTDRKGIITYVNDKFCQISQYSREELLGHTHRILNSGEHNKTFFRDMYRTLYSGQTWHGNLCNRAKDGSHYWVATTIIPHKNANGEISGFVATRFEITELMNTKVRLKKQAATDVMTGLLNRGGFNASLVTAVEASKRRNADPQVLVMFDLDGFKPVNDIHGHHAGDEVLKTIATRLIELIGSQDAISRLGGDEFAVILHHSLKLMPLQTILNRIQNLLEEPIMLDSATVRISGSIGATPITGEESLEALQKNADVAVYAAKQAGGKQARMFTPSLHRTTMERAKILSEARQGVAQKQFEVYYQPILNARTGRIEQAEALMRWHHPERGLLSAGAFTDVFADSALAQIMETHLVQSFHDDIQKWKEAGLPSLRLAVNLSHLDLLNLEQQIDLFSEIRQLNLDPSTFMLEVTEQMLQGRRAEKSRLRLRGLAEDGFGLAMDNFGYGTVRLSTLRELPLQSLKLDRCLVRDIATDAKARSLLASLIKLGHGYNLAVTVEGVETLEEFDTVRALGVDYVQGFFISRAVSATELIRITREDAWNPAPTTA